MLRLAFAPSRFGRVTRSDRDTRKRDATPRLHRALEGLFNDWGVKGVTTPLWHSAAQIERKKLEEAAHSESTRMRVAFNSSPAELAVPGLAELIYIDPQLQASTCSWHNCSGMWHMDGGGRGYKIWAMVEKDDVLDSEMLRRLELAESRWTLQRKSKQARAALSHSNLFVATNGNAQVLCKEQLARYYLLLVELLLTAHRNHAGPVQPNRLLPSTS